MAKIKMVNSWYFSENNECWFLFVPRLYGFLFIYRIISGVHISNTLVHLFSFFIRYVFQSVSQVLVLSIYKIYTMLINVSYMTQRNIFFYSFVFYFRKDFLMLFKKIWKYSPFIIIIPFTCMILFSHYEVYGMKNTIYL